MNKLFKLLSARYLVSAYWDDIRVHPAKTFAEAMEWCECYPSVPVTIIKRVGLFKYQEYLTLTAK